MKQFKLVVNNDGSITILDDLDRSEIIWADAQSEIAQVVVQELNEAEAF